MLPVALRERIILAAGLFDFVVEQQLGVIADIGAAGIIAGDRCEQVFAEWHEQSRSISRRRSRRWRKLQRTYFEKRDFFTIQKQNLLSRRIFVAFIVGSPIGDSSQPDVFVGMLPGEGVNRRDQDFAEVGAFKRWTGANHRGSPQCVAQTPGRLHFERGYVLERNPEIGARRKY